MFRLRPITEADVIRAMEEPQFNRFPQDEKELAALYNRILEDKLFEALNPSRRTDGEGRD